MIVFLLFCGGVALLLIAQGVIQAHTQREPEEVEIRWRVYVWYSGGRRAIYSEAKTEALAWDFARQLIEIMEDGLEWVSCRNEYVRVSEITEVEIFESVG